MRTALIGAVADHLLELAAEVPDVLGAERLASELCGAWHEPGPAASRGDAGSTIEDALADGLVAAVRAGDDDRALAALCALAVGAPDPIARRASGAARRLTRSGCRDPAWWARARTTRPTAAALLVGAEDRGTELVLLEFEREAEDRHCVAAVVSHDRGGVATALDLCRDIPTLWEGAERASGGAPLETLSLSLGEARTRVLRAMERTESVGDPLLTESYARHRGLVQRRLELIGRHVVADERAGVGAADGGDTANDGGAGC